MLNYRSQPLGQVPLRSNPYEPYQGPQGISVESISIMAASASGGGGGGGGFGGGGKGSPGAKGSQGNQGNQGNAATAGGTGIQGPQGNQGNAGATGATGVQGPQGNQGNAGTAGAAGVQGPQGNQGNQGNQGAIGAGVQGPQGPQGSQGNQGAQGVQGAQGPAGGDIGVRLYNSGNQTIPESSTLVVLWDSESYDTDTMHSTVSNTSRITFTTAGKYLIYADAFADGVSGGIRSTLTVRLNGTTTLFVTIQYGVEGGGPAFTQATFEYDFAANDYIELLMGSNGAAATLIGAVQYCFGARKIDKAG